MAVAVLPVHWVVAVTVACVASAAAPAAVALTVVIYTVSPAGRLPMLSVEEESVTRGLSELSVTVIPLALLLPRLATAMRSGTVVPASSGLVGVTPTTKG